MDEMNSDKGAVVLTGASRGLGRNMARYLSTRGFHVFAGCRKPADASSLVDETQHRYQSEFEQTRRLIASFDQVAADPQEVSEAVFEALTAESPRTRYLVGEAAQEVAGLLSLSDEARDEAFMQMWNQVSYQ